MSQFQLKFKAWLASLPEYSSNEAARAANYPVGWPYWNGERLLKVV
jgi:hypothetical protein